MQPFYKLHGSVGWVDNIHPEIMLLGDNKARDLSQFPLLLHYFECFETALNSDDARLVVIGYSFRDKHINEVLVRAVMDYGMKFFVVDPSGTDITRNVRSDANGLVSGPPSELEEAFVQGCRGASRRSLREIFGSDSVEFHKVMRFFEE